MAAMTTVTAVGVLYRRLGEYVALADVDDAIARAARQVGLSPASPAAVVDSDLAGLAAADHDYFLDTAELRGWHSIFGNATDAGMRDVALDESPREVREVAREKIKALSGYVKDVYGVGMSTISVGSIGLDFQAGADSAGDDWSD